MRTLRVAISLAVAGSVGLLAVPGSASAAGSGLPSAATAAADSGTPPGSGPAVSMPVDPADAPESPSAAVDPQNAPPAPEAVTVVTETPDGGLQVDEIPTADPAAQAAKLRDRPNVVAASPVKTRAILGAPDSVGAARDLQWALNQLGAEDAWRSSAGAGITVAVVDTGVDAGHPDLAGSVVTGYDAIRDRASADLADFNGHGTHVAGTIAGHGAVSGIAPRVKIMPIRVMDSRGFGTTASIVAGIIWAVNSGADVINLSLGSALPDASERAAVRWARGRGVLVIAAAGNDGTGEPTYPAAYQDYSSDAAVGIDPVVGVGATDRAFGRGFFSQHGNPVDLVAPGVRVLSTYPRSRGAYSWESGTSMAAPYVAGIAALALSYRKGQLPNESLPARALAVERALRDAALDLGRKGRDQYFGYGLVSAAATLHRMGAAPTAGMVRNLALVGNKLGRAQLVMSAPAGTQVQVRLTTAPGHRGAPPATSVADGVGVYSGPGGSTLVRTLSGLSPKASYTVTVFTSGRGHVSRTLAGLRPVTLSVSRARTIQSQARPALAVRAVLPSFGGIPSGAITVKYRWKGKRSRAAVSPMSSARVNIPLPVRGSRLKYRVWIAGGYGNWPAKSRQRVLRIAAR